MTNTASHITPQSTPQKMPGYVLMALVPLLLL